jgi:hypothetical protein
MDTSHVRLFHAPGNTHAIFDDEHVIAYGGLLPAMRLAERCGLADLVGESVAIGDRDGVIAPVKVPGIVAGMLAGVDSIDDLEVLRHGGMDKVFTGVRAPSTFGSFLRSFTWGNVRQLEKVSRELLARLAAHTPLLPRSRSRSWTWTRCSAVPSDMPSRARGSGTPRSRVRA